MVDCQTRSEFLLRAMRVGIDPDQMIGICKLHCLGLGYGPWESMTSELQDEVIGDLLDRIETLNRAGIQLIDGQRLQELERCERTLRHLGEIAVERMHQSF